MLSIKSEEKKMAALCRDVFISKLRKFRLFFLLYSSIAILLFHMYLSILSRFFTLVEKISQECGSSFICIIYFFKFTCVSKVIRLLILVPLKKNFKKRVQIKDDEEAKCQWWWRARKQEIAWASCVQVVFISRIFIHTVRKGHFATQDWTEGGATKWRAFF